MSDYRAYDRQFYEGPTTTDDSNTKKSNPEDKIFPIFLVIALLMFVTGHYPHLF